MTDFDVNRTTISGKRIGRNNSSFRFDMEKIYRMIDADNIPVSEICRILKCSRTTLLRHHRKYQEENPAVKRKYLTGNSINRTARYRYIDMEEVLREVDQGKTIKQVCLEKNISRTTLRRKFLQYREEKIKDLEQAKLKEEDTGNGEN